MNVLKTLALVGVAICGVVAWDAFKPEGGMREVIDGVRGQAQTGREDGSFVELPAAGRRLRARGGDLRTGELSVRGRAEGAAAGGRAFRAAHSVPRNQQRELQRAVVAGGGRAGDGSDERPDPDRLRRRTRQGQPDAGGSGRRVPTQSFGLVATNQKGNGGNQACECLQRMNSVPFSALFIDSDLRRDSG